MANVGKADSTTKTVKTALAAVKRGYTPLPIRSKAKAPNLAAWTRLSFKDQSPAEIRKQFEDWAEEGMTNIGLLLGEASGGLVDIDLDHHHTMRLKNYFLPPTPMRTGRESRPNSHYWYLVKEGTLPGNRRHKMPDGSISVELRSTKSQTVIPPSIHPSGESYVWEGDPWGGKKGPTLIDGRLLALQVATLGLSAVLLENWPGEGGRHEAYLALAGSLLRYGESGVHPFWERNLRALIHALADATHDEDGPDARVSEVMGSTIDRLRNGEKVVGYGKLAEILGDDHVRQIKVMVRDVESAAGFVHDAPEIIDDSTPEPLEGEAPDAETVPSSDNPLDLRETSWSPVDLDPYLAGEIATPDADIMEREDGAGLMYRGRVNMLYGSSETAKSWIALYTCMQEIARGERVIYLDFEDEPENTLSRLGALGAAPDDIRLQFTYIRPEEPLASMQRNKFGSQVTVAGQANLHALNSALTDIDPSLIVADGMTELYGLHGLDPNDAMSTAVITSWLKSLSRNGRTTVIIIDHTSKSAVKGSLPIGSQHKQAMVQGTLLQVWPVRQPMPGAVGEVELVVVKDRPGKVRKVSVKSGEKAQVSAKVILDSSKAEGETTMTISVPPNIAPEGGGSQVTVDLAVSRDAERAEHQRKWEERIARNAFGGELDSPRTLQQIHEVMDSFGNRAAVNAAMKRMLSSGQITREKGESQGRGRPPWNYFLNMAGFDA